LLQADAIFRTPCVRGRQTGQPLDHGEEGLRRGRLALHQRAIAREHQDLRNLDGLVGVLPNPGAARVAGTEGLLHHGANSGGVIGFASLEQRDEGICSLHQVLSNACSLGQGRGL
jgi:hypothetical protein